MLLIKLLKELDDLTITPVVGSVSNSIVIEKIGYLEKNPYLQLTTLKIGCLSEFMKKCEMGFRFYGIFFLIKDCEASYEEFEPEKIRIFEIKDKTEPEILAEKCRKVLRMESDEDEICAFTTAILQKTTLTRLLYYAAKTFQCKIIAASSGGRKIYGGYEYDSSVKKPVFLVPSERHFTIENHARSLQKNYGKDYSDSEPYAVFNSESGQWLLQSKLFGENGYLGYLVAYCPSLDALASIHVRKFQILGSMIVHMLQTAHLQNNHFGKNEDDYLRVLLGDLLDESIDARILSGDDEQSPFLKTTQKRICSFPIDEYAYKNKADGYLISTLRKCFPDSVCFYYKRDIVVVLDADRDGKAFHEKRGEFLQLLEKNHLQVYISDEFSDIALIHRHYQQCQRTRTIKNLLNRDGRIFYYDDFKCSAMALELCKDGDTDKLEEFCSEDLRNIREYDEVNHTEYYALLKIYVISGKSMSACARQMYLHKSTVAYRLNKLKELFGLDLDNHEKFFDYYNSFLLMELMGVNRKK